MFRQIIAAAALLNAIDAGAFQNEPDGFRGIPWGTPIENHMAEMQRIDAKDHLILYERNNDQMTIGGAELEKLRYIFYKGVFYSVMIDASGISNRIKLTDAFQSQFGAGVKPNRYLNQFHWIGSKARISLNCTMAEKCTGLIVSREISDRQRAEEKAETSEKAKKDF